MTIERSADICLEFDLRHQDTGVRAVDCWRALGPEYQRVEHLYDLLLIELEHSKWNKERIREAEKLLGAEQLSEQKLQEFITDIFVSRVELGAQPRLGDFHMETDCRHLRVDGDPCHLGQLLGGRYQVDQRVGHGSFGVVYRVIDHETGQSLACKAPRVRSGGTADPRHTELLYHEAAAMKELAGHGCPRDYQVVEFEGHPFLLMEFVEGESLRSRISSGALTVTLAAKTLANIARTLEHAQQHRIVHRDLKPENVLLDVTGEPYVVDFGLVLFNDDEQFDREGERYGTRGYMSPDSLLGFTHELDGRADVFSIGMVAFETVGGTLRSAATREEALVAAIGAASVGLEWPDTVPADYRSVAEKCVQPNPLHRYATAGEVAVDFEAVALGVALPSEKLPTLSAWWAGLGFGKFMLYHNMGEMCLDKSAHSAKPQGELQMALISIFGAQEAANDLCKTVADFPRSNIQSLDDAEKQLRQSFPAGASDSLRQAFYGRGKSSDAETIRGLTRQVNEWITLALEYYQARTKAISQRCLALLEFGILASQAENSMVAEAPNLSHVAQMTELPEDIYAEFCDAWQDPTSDELRLAFQKLKREVEMHLRRNADH